MTEGWLTPQEQQAWFAYVTASNQLRSALDRQLQAEAGIPHSWYGLLAMLSSRPGHRARLGALAGAAEFSLSRLSYAVARLLERGWVTREQDPDDRRGWVITLTPAGHDTLAAAAPGHVAEVRRLFFDGLTAEQVQTLAEVFRGVAERASRGGDPGPVRDASPDEGG